MDGQRRHIFTQRLQLHGASFHQQASIAASKFRHRLIAFLPQAGALLYSSTGARPGKSGRCIVDLPVVTNLLSVNVALPLTARVCLDILCELRSGHQTAYHVRRLNWKTMQLRCCKIRMLAFDYGLQQQPPSLRAW